MLFSRGRHAIERLQIENRRRDEELRAGFDLVIEPAPFGIRARRERIHADADMKPVGAPIDWPADVEPLFSARPC